MANNIPYLYESNFELGDNSEWDSEADTGSLLNFRHYSFLARHDSQTVGAIAPWRGAWCAEFGLLGDTNDHILIKATSPVIADGKIGYANFMLFLGKNLQATADDVFSILEMQGTANAVEGLVALKITAATGAIQLGYAQKAADITFGGNILQRGKWYNIELVDTIVVGSATGTTQVFVDGTAHGAAVTNAAVNTAVLRAVLGTQDTLSTTTGHLFMDQFRFSSNAASATITRIGQQRDRYPDTVLVTKSTHLALGNSELLNVTLLPGAGTNNVLKIFDTNKFTSTIPDDQVAAILYNLTASEPPIDLADVPINCKRGVYVQLAGTNPQALIHIGRSQGWGSHGQIRQLGLQNPPDIQVTQ